MSKRGLLHGEISNRIIGLFFQVYNELGPGFLEAVYANAMFVALTSLLTERPVRSDIAMTGEISLRGLVLPIGGVKEKVLAALRAGITTVMLPARNRRDLDDIPADARERVRIEWLETVDDALRIALTPVPQAVAA